MKFFSPLEDISVVLLEKLEAQCIKFVQGAWPLHPQLHPESHLECLLEGRSAILSK